jgi:hypothetical protein
MAIFFSPGSGKLHSRVNTNATSGIMKKYLTTEKIMHIGFYVDFLSYVENVFEMIINSAKATKIIFLEFYMKIDLSF